MKVADIFLPGTQITYIPAGKDGDRYDAVEKGFVFSVKDETVWCRFFYPPPNENELRTTNNSESCSPDRLRIDQHHDQGFVDELLNEIRVKMLVDSGYGCGYVSTGNDSHQPFEQEYPLLNFTPPEVDEFIEKEDDRT